VKSVSFGDILTKDDEILEELRQIRKLLEPKPAPPAPPPKKGLWNEFMDFLSKYRVMGLAVAFIMGVYLGALVNALVKDLILPIIGLAIPGLGDLATYQITIGQQVFAAGDFLAALVTFVIVAFVIFLIVKITRRWGIE
jgi:large conductance mechanosensitive channel